MVIFGIFCDFAKLFICNNVFLLCNKYNTCVLTTVLMYYTIFIVAVSYIGLYRENAIAIESEARYPFGGNVYHVTMQITFPIPEFARKERNLHCDVVHVTTKWVSRLVLDHAIAAIQTSR